jgi:hypothetical protein
MRQQMNYIALRPAFGITPAVREKLMRISPVILALKGKSLTKPAALLKHRIPIRTFYTSEERKLPGFIWIDTIHHCEQITSGRYILTLIATDAASGRICLCSLLNNAHRWTFATLKNVYTSLPFPLREFHGDNGAAGLSTTPSPTASVTPTALSLSPDRKKNNNRFVEQKNGTVVREYIGYGRLEGDALHAHLAAV